MKLSLRIGAILVIGIFLSSILSLVVLSLANPLIPGTDILSILTKTLLVIVFSIIPVTLLLWFYFYYFFIKKILNFNNVTKMIASGNLSTRVSENNIDEIGEVGHNLNIIISNMVKALQSMADSLRDSIRKAHELDVNLRELSREKAKDDALLTSIGDGVVAIDSAGDVVFSNQESKLMLGYGQDDELKGKYWKDVILPLGLVKGELEPLKELIIEEAQAEGKKIHSSCYFKRQDNTSFPASISVSPVMIGGKANGVILVFKDITKEKEIDRMKTDFISLASHQLRTPLSAIRWFSELLMENVNGTMSPDDLELAQNINLSTKRMNDLVGSLLNISRIESGRIIIEPKPTDLKALVSDIISELEIKIKEKNQNVELITQDNLPQINVDPKLIRHVYMNLLTNAIKYTPAEGKITINIYRETDHIISKVSDNGYGIPKSSQSKIFQKFFRAENVLKFETDGSGLGLYLVKSIVESSKGKIWFESEEGKGTTFIFTLPLSGMEAKAGEVTLGS